MSTSVETGVLAFLERRTQRAWAPEADIFASGVVTSLFALELVLYLEHTFGVAVTGEYLLLDNFRTARAMSTLVERLRTETAA